MGVKVSEAYEMGIIPEDIMDVLPNNGYCEYCDNELSLSDNFTQLYCDNAYCSSKIAARLEFMMKSLDIDNWGESACLKAARDFKLKSPYAIFKLTEFNINYKDISNFKNKVDILKKVRNKPIPFWRVVQIAAIPGIDTIAFKLLNNYNSADEFYSDLHKEEVSLIYEKLGLSEESKVMGVRIYNTFVEYESEIRFGESIFNIQKVADTVISIAITGEVYGYSSKKKYIEELNDLYGDKVTIYMSNTLTKNTYALICDNENSQTNKAVKAEKYGIKVFNSRQFKSHMAEVYNKQK